MEIGYAYVIITPIESPAAVKALRSVYSTVIVARQVVRRRTRVFVELPASHQPKRINRPQPQCCPEVLPFPVKLFVNWRHKVQLVTRHRVVKLAAELFKLRSQPAKLFNSLLTGHTGRQSIPDFFIPSNPAFLLFVDFSLTLKLGPPIIHRDGIFEPTESIPQVPHQ